jgi:chorismate mutase
MEKSPRTVHASAPDPMNGAEQLAALRLQLDEINLQLLERLEARGRLVREVMAIKQRLGLGVHDPQREQGMLDRLLARASGVFPRSALERVFREVFAASRGLGAEVGSHSDATKPSRVTNQF